MIWTIILSIVFFGGAFYFLFPEWFRKSATKRDLSYKPNSWATRLNADPPTKTLVSRRDSQPIQGHKVKLSVNSKTRMGYRRPRSNGVGYEYYDEFGHAIDESLFEIYVMELMAQEDFYPSDEGFDLNNTTEVEGFLKHGEDVDLPPEDEDPITKQEFNPSTYNEPEYDNDVGYNNDSWGSSDDGGSWDDD